MSLHHTSLTGWLADVRPPTPKAPRLLRHIQRQACSFTPPINAHHRNRIAATCCSASTSTSRPSSSSNSSNHQHSSNNTQSPPPLDSQPQAAVDSTSGRLEGASTEQLVTFEEVQEIAAVRGLHISLKTLGPFYRITCRDGGAEGRILGVTNGFVAPLFGLMHCDTLQIFTKGMKGVEADRVRKNPLGLGLLLGGAVFSYGRSCGCRKAEILAINDDDAWHERLVRYYTYFGFKPVCKVGGQGFFQDLPHLLVWGGEGTRLDADIDDALTRWTPALRQSRRKAQQQQQQQQQQQEGTPPAPTLL